MQCRLKKQRANDRTEHQQRVEEREKYMQGLVESNMEVLKSKAGKGDQEFGEGFTQKLRPQKKEEGGRSR